MAQSDISAHDMEDEKHILDVDSEKVVVDNQNKERPSDKSDQEIIEHKHDKILVNDEPGPEFFEEEKQDVNENSVQENLNISTTVNELEYFSVPLGPLVNLTVPNFEMLSGNALPNRKKII